jgi:hypothetical protein
MSRRTLFTADRTASPKTHVSEKPPTRMAAPSALMTVH